MFLCENLSCVRDGKTLSENLSFCLPMGSFLLLKGKNGIGKTTLLHTLAGLRKPAKGAALWHGTSIWQNMQFNQELVYIGEANGLKPSLSVRHNLALWAKYYSTELRMPSAIHYFDLGHLLETPVYALSAGWQRRVALARLLFAPGKIWMLDEPTNYVDDAGVALLVSLIETRILNGGIVIVVSHAMRSAFAAHMLMLEDFIPDEETHGLATL